MTSAYQLKPWTQVAIPHADIRNGRLDSSVYAASLGAVVRQDPQCPPVYCKAVQFFAATYLTKELKKLLETVLQGLCGQPGDRVLQLRTPFGGGKTHALASLYHITKNRDQIVQLDDPDQRRDLNLLPNPGPVQVAAFIGIDMDAITGTQIPDGTSILTPWGYLAWQIGGAAAYALVAQQDQQRIAPGNDVIRQMIGDRSVLVLIDELLVYIENAMALPVGDSTFGRQVLTFVQKLTEVVRELPKTVLVYSLQASVQEAVGNEGLLGALDKLVSRIDAKKEPVSGDEVMKVVQRRLFESLSDPETIAEIAAQQAELYGKFRESYAETDRSRQEAQQEAALLAERIKLSYPFHPDLMDLMYHRWGSLPSYQRTRGALQFLARVVYALWQTKDTSWLITPGDVLFQDEGVRGAFFSQVGEREQYSSVIEADLIGKKAKVKVIDARIAQDAPALSQFKLGTRLTSAILMYSFGARGGEDRGVLEQDITAACLAPGLDRNLITATLSDLRDSLLYLHHVGKRYRFETKPNLNKLIADEESKIAGEYVLEKIRTELGTLLQTTRGKVSLWAKDSLAIADRDPRFTVVYLSPDWAEKSRDVVNAEAMQWLEQRGNDKRDYKNALAFVVPNKLQIDKARKGARLALSISSLLEQKKKYQFTPEDVEELTAKSKDAANEVSAALRRLYEYVLLPLPSADLAQPIYLETFDLQSQIHTSQNLQDRVLDALKNNVFETIQVTKLAQLSGLESSETGYTTGDELVSFFFRFPNFPKMLDAQGLRRAILQAIEQGSIGYIPYLTIPSTGRPKVENADLISFRRAIPNDELDLSGYLLSPALVQQLRETLLPKQDLVFKQAEDTPSLQPNDDDISIDQSVNEKTVEYKSEASSLTRSVLVDIIDGKRPARIYSLEATTNKSKLFQLFEVLQTLSDQSDDMTIQIKVKATTTKQFDRTWINGAIEEPLDELDIRASTRLE